MHRVLVWFEFCIGLKGLEDGVPMTSSTGFDIPNGTQSESEGLLHCLQ